MKMKRFYCSTFPKRVLAILILTFLAHGSSPAENVEAKSNTTRLKAATPETGIASYYGVPYHGRQTASGEVFNMNELTAAHPTLKFGAKVKVTHLANNRSVTVRINDRGPFVKGRIIDLSKAAAAELQMVQRGLAEVKIEIVE
jgi:rare lipoprotein A